MLQQIARFHQEAGPLPESAIRQLVTAFYAVWWRVPLPLVMHFEGSDLRNGQEERAVSVRGRPSISILQSAPRALTRPCPSGSSSIDIKTC